MLDDRRFGCIEEELLDQHREAEAAVRGALLLVEQVVEQPVEWLGVLQVELLFHEGGPDQALLDDVPCCLRIVFASSSERRTAATAWRNAARS